MSRDRAGLPVYVDDIERIQFIEMNKNNPQKKIRKMSKEAGIPITLTGIIGYLHGMTKVCGWCEREHYWRYCTVGTEYFGCSNSCSQKLKFEKYPQGRRPKPEPEPEPIPYEIDLFLHKLRPTA